MITYKTDKIKVEIEHIPFFGECITINNHYSIPYETYKELCKSFEYIEEMRKAVNK